MARLRSREKQFGGVKSEPTGDLENQDEQMDITKPAEDPAKPEIQQFDETLLKCDVCLDIMHTPVNCSPCNHKFCASCIYRWLDLHYTCPKCRYLVKEATKDLFVSQVCDEFYKQHPERARGELVTDEQDRTELEYLEKLIERAKSRHYSAFHLDDNDLDQINPTEFEDQIRHFAHDSIFDHHIPTNMRPPRRLCLSVSRRFRVAEWEQRAERLRLKFNMPARRVPTPVPDDGPARHARVRAHPLDLMRIFMNNGADGNGDSDSSDDGARIFPIRNATRMGHGNLILHMLESRRRISPNETNDNVNNGTGQENGRNTPRLERQRATRDRSNQMPERTREERARAREQRAQARDGNVQPVPPLPTRRRSAGSTPRANSNRSEPYNLRHRRQ